MYQLTRKDTSPMTHGIFSWLALIIYSALLWLYGLYVAPEHMLWGKPFFVWPIRASWLMLGVGLVLGVFYAATGRLRRVAPARPRTRYAPGCVGNQRGSFMSGDVAIPVAAIAGFSGLLVNVDGTPMMDDGMVDVMGKTYGDSGADFSLDFGCNMDSSSIGGSDW
jgi:hypothetical protein